MNPIRRIWLSSLAIAGVGGAVAADDWDYRPLRIVQTYDANFSPVLLAEGITTGQVRAVLHVDADGTLADCLVLGYTRPELLTDFQAMLRDWRFEPALDRGVPIGVRKEISFFFEAKGAVLSVSLVDSGNTMSRLAPAEFVSVSCLPTELDQPLMPVERVSPAHPGAQLRPAQRTGRAAVDFYVDSEGRTRMPVVVSASHEAFGAAAAEAITRWRFAPPTRVGKRVAVRVRQEFVFSPHS